MNIILKYYPKRFTKKAIVARVKWTPEFLQSISDFFGIKGEFTVQQIENLFPDISNTACRLKFNRLYKYGIFKRELKYDENSGKRIFFYRFSEGSKDYYHYWGGFNYNNKSPLLRNRKNAN